MKFIYYISICKSHYLFLSFILQLQSKWHRASTTLDMLPLCAWSVHLSELRFYRWQAGASDEHFIATGRALRSWLWLDIDHICGTFSLYIMPTGSLSQLVILSGEYPYKHMSFYKIDVYIIFVFTVFLCHSTFLLRPLADICVRYNAFRKDRCDWGTILNNCHSYGIGHTGTRDLVN